jgi:hypothetical protein
MSYVRNVWFTTEFEGFHRWKDAPAEAAFLRVFHRHIFKIRAHASVSHGDRDIEFILLKQRVTDWVRSQFERKSFELSCEHIGEQLLEQFPELNGVTVSEDGENGALVTRKIQPQLLEVPPEMPPTDVLAWDPAKRVVRSIRATPFIGIEAEGPHKGVHYLFLPGNTRVAVADQVWHHVNRHLKNPPQGIYYGAGNMRNLEDGGMLDWLSQRLDRGVAVTIETDNYNDMEAVQAALGGAVMTVWAGPLEMYLDFEIRPQFFKVITDHEILWFGSGAVGQCYRTAVNDPLFLADKEVS